MDDNDQVIKPCIHCRGTGICGVCHGTGELALQHGMKCTQCFPKGSGWCQNCRGFGGRDGRGRPAAYGRAAAVIAAETAAREMEAKSAEEVPPDETAAPPMAKPGAPQADEKRQPEAKKVQPEAAPIGAATSNVPKNALAKDDASDQRTGKTAPGKSSGSSQPAESGNSRKTGR